jgi:hypothetical protein
VKSVSQTVETRILGIDLRNAVITVEYLTRVTTTITTTVTVTRTKTVTAVVATAITIIYTHPLTTITTVVPTNTTITVIEGGETVATAPVQTFVSSPSPMAQKTGEMKPQPVPLPQPVAGGGGASREVARLIA